MGESNQVPVIAMKTKSRFMNSITNTFNFKNFQFFFLNAATSSTIFSYGNPNFLTYLKTLIFTFSQNIFLPSCRRGFPKEVYSDRGRNFKGGKTMETQLRRYPAIP